MGIKSLVDSRLPKAAKFIYSPNHDWYVHLHASSSFWDRLGGTRIIVLHCKATSSFNSMVNVLDHHCIIPAAQCRLCHSLVEVERSWRIVSRSDILWVHISQLYVCSSLRNISTRKCWSGELPDKIPQFLRPQSINIWHASFTRGGCCLGSSLFSFVAVPKKNIFVAHILLITLRGRY